MTPADRAALVALVAQWRERAQRAQYIDHDKYLVYRRCADELAALIAARDAADKEQ